MKNRQKIQITCQKCGKPTLVGSSRGKYCEKCKHKIHLEYNSRAKYRKRQSLMLTCKLCGKDLTDIKRSSKYCPDCRSGVVAKYNRDNYGKYREKRLLYYKEYYKKPENKERHRESARKSFLRRKKINKHKLVV